MVIIWDGLFTSSVGNVRPTGKYLGPEILKSFQKLAEHAFNKKAF